MVGKRPLKVAFVHPDLGIGGAERLVVDAALGLQKLGHSVDIYTSHHDPSHCFEETRDGTLSIRYIRPTILGLLTIPRSLAGKLHIVFAHARQMHLTAHLLFGSVPKYDVYFVDQLSTCVPLLRAYGGVRVVFYCHFPDKLLANGEFVDGGDGTANQRKGSLVKRIYRYPMDQLEEITTRKADVLLANSKFTARVFQTYFPSIGRTPKVVYPGINLEAYDADVDWDDPNIQAVTSSHPTLLSLNRFEKKKNAALAVEAFALLRKQLVGRDEYKNLRLVLAGGYDPRLEDNTLTFSSLIDLIKSHSLTYNVTTPTGPDGQPHTKIPPLDTTLDSPDVLLLLNFTTGQRTALLKSPSTKALLYTPANEHFGIGPVEAMSCGVPVLACDSGGPTESLLDPSYQKDREPLSSAKDDVRTGWLRIPKADIWAAALLEIFDLTAKQKDDLSRRAKERARSLFGMEAMARGIEEALEEAAGLGGVSLTTSTWVVMFVGFVLAFFLGLFMF